MNVCPSAVRYWRKKFNLPPNVRYRRRKIDYEELRELVKKGWMENGRGIP
ncbi:MAG: hypothetical protein ACTSYT_04635 [Candidatus Asgardarchaeia archaeon]